MCVYVLSIHILYCKYDNTIPGVALGFIYLLATVAKICSMHNLGATYYYCRNLLLPEIEHISLIAFQITTLT